MIACKSSAESHLSSCKCCACDSKESLSNDNNSKNDNAERKIRLFRNVKLPDLVGQFEAALQKVKELELTQLIEPIETAINKLKELHRYTETLACDYYDGYPCANKNCVYQLSGSEKSEEFLDFCTRQDVTPKERLTEDTNVTFELKKSESPVTNNAKCDPCECRVDDSGKNVKTLCCKMASRAKRSQRGEDKREKCHDLGEKLPARTPGDNSNVILEREFLNTKTVIQTNLNELSLSVNKENTKIKDSTYLGKKRNNQATLCNLSSESSTDEYISGDTTDTSNDTACIIPTKVTHYQNDEKSTHGGCCGRTVKGIVGENEVQPCPCGCGDAMDLTKGRMCHKLSCRCENCGKEIKDNGKKVPFNDVMSERAAGATDSTGKSHHKEPGKTAVGEKLLKESYVIPNSDVDDYIDVLENQCRKKDMIIMRLTKELIQRADENGDR